MKPEQALREFMTAMDQPVADSPRNIIPEDVHTLIKKLISSEQFELFDELAQYRRNDCDIQYKHIDRIAKEGADLVYVVIWMFVALGIPFDRVFELVHESNMTKLVDGKPLKDESGKVQKGPNYRRPIIDVMNGIYELEE